MRKLNNQKSSDFDQVQIDCIRKNRKIRRVKIINCVLWKVLLNLLILKLPRHVYGASETIGVCAMPECNCSIVVHHWINVKCMFSNYQDVELHEGSIPADASEVSISRCRELRIHSGAFTGGAQLKRVYLTGIHSFVAKRQAFNNISAPNPLLEVSECNKVVLESHAFKSARGTLSVFISRCKHVEIMPNAFSWLLRFTVKEVPTLQLSTNAFKFHAPPYGRHGPATKIMLQSVKISELPSFVFPSAAAEIRMDDVWMRVIRKDAFCAMMILNIKISNASIFEIEAGALSDETLIPNFELVDVRLKTIKSGAFKAAFTNFTIQYSRISEIESGAIESSAATVKFNNNEFHSLRKKSIILKQWSKITIDENLFVELAEEAIVADDMARATPESPDLEFSFRRNRINRAADGSLRFASVSQRATYAKVGDNYFEKACNCLIETWMRQVSGKNTSALWMMDSSFCVAGKWLEKCFKVPQGYLAMRNFTNLICTPEGDITCKEPSEKPPATGISPPSVVGPHIYSKHNSYFDVEMMNDPEQLEQEKRLLIIISIVIICIILGVIITSSIVIIRHRGAIVCPKVISRSLNFSSSWLSSSNQQNSSRMRAETSAATRSISRLSINEYAGLQHDIRMMDLENSEHHMNDGSSDDENDNADAVDNYAYTENKATQTLPEELTEEYLSDLRECLNDPDNYSNARDMIEHLYDLIKVEECCNNNNIDDRVHSQREENAYDVIAPRIKKSRNIKLLVDMGTRVPSLEKLLPPLAKNIHNGNGPPPPPPVIVDYMEPRDQRTAHYDHNHLYAELPSDETVPSTSKLSQIIPVNSNFQSNDHALQIASTVDVTEKHKNLIDKKFYTPDIKHQRNDYDEKHTQELDFLKVLGQSVLVGSKLQRHTQWRSPLLICEYTNSSNNSTIGHHYSEPLESERISKSISKMANRPLPTKPTDQNGVNLAGT